MNVRNVCADRECVAKCNSRYHMQEEEEEEEDTHIHTLYIYIYCATPQSRFLELLRFSFDAIPRESYGEDWWTGLDAVNQCVPFEAVGPYVADPYKLCVCDKRSVPYKVLIKCAASLLM